ncbi:MAG: selenium-dependent molybdenum cofactor biosynthesis protein YqeB [Chloroflexota bacterium]
MDPIIIIRGGGDIASGVALRLHRSGFRVVILELEQPLSVRRTVSFSEAIYTGQTFVEEVKARKIKSFDEIPNLFLNNEIPIMVDENLSIISMDKSYFPVLIDARMNKKPPEINYIKTFPLVIGIGPGFSAGTDCNVVIESSRGHFLGHVYRKGSALSDTGKPAGDPNRILRAPINGIIITKAEIGDFLNSGQLIATIDDQHIIAPFTGLLRGLIHSGLHVQKGTKIGDMDHNTNIDLVHYASDKAMAIGGSVLEIILSDTNILPTQKKLT